MATADPWEPTAAERDDAANHLKAAVSDGCLTLDEFNERLDAVYSAHSAREIHAVLATVPFPTPSRPHGRRTLAIIAAAGALIAAAAAFAIVGAARSTTSAARDCGCRGQGLVATSRNAGAQQNTVPDGAPDPVTCARSVSFSTMETSTLNAAFWLPLPDDSQVRRCAAIARLPTSAQPLSEVFHIHLDLQFMSGAVRVPRGLGVDQQNHAYTAIYTDNDQGLVAVGAQGLYTLGQLFEEWGHPLGRDSVGHMRMLDGYPMHWFVNGAPLVNAASLVLHNHDEIECFQDIRGASINPEGSYNFPSGY